MSIKKLAIISLIVFGSCTQSQDISGIRSKETGINGEEIYNFDSDFQEMNVAIDSARKTFKLFDEANKHPKKTQTLFAVKYPFSCKEGREHLWLVDVVDSANSYYGTIDNDADLTKEVKYGQRIPFNPDSISDWKFIENGKLKGGFTIRVIYNNMTEIEKKDFLNEFGFDL